MTTKYILQCLNTSHHPSIVQWLLTYIFKHTCMSVALVDIILNSCTQNKYMSEFIIYTPVLYTSRGYLLMAS